jgi:hypothetical protein
MRVYPWVLAVGVKTPREKIKRREKREREMQQQVRTYTLPEKQNPRSTLGETALPGLGQKNTSGAR